MKDFSRVLQLAVRRRWAIAGVACTSLLIALLWGANIGTLYPMVEVVFQGESLPQYTERTLKELRESGLLSFLRLSSPGLAQHQTRIGGGGRS